ncbi:platelet-activating factor acetylhydrolase IB subunit beta/gamma [Azospirillum brasilense]|uniref:Platelet-activating factor acetylhydrolase IB subunit beta/gamma n=1 Tax=Azospirillum brasilense TaxID=192 RepID=A0A560BJF0_AZOBR|nr:GDSL-type esterase/lipase family protein [Azospirillum brasilense]TWA72744.1 platelet-activating factor acetylhydrolase IB subunit beta/gamma [Azospirillum brasilense]
MSRITRRGLAGIAALLAVLAAPVLGDTTIGPRAQPPYPDWLTTRMETLRRQDPKAMLLGDSLVAGWPPDLARRLFDAEPMNFGAGGDTTGNLLWRVRHSFGPGMGLESALLLVGTNDLPNRSAAEIADTIGTIAAEVKRSAPGACVTLLTLLPRRDGNVVFAERVAEVNRRLTTLAGPGLRVVDANTPLRDACPTEGACPLYKDPVHLSRAGYERLTATIGKAGC